MKLLLQTLESDEKRETMDQKIEKIRGPCLIIALGEHPESWYCDRREEGTRGRRSGNLLDSLKYAGPALALAGPDCEVWCTS